MLKQTLSVLKISTLALILSFGLSYALAWTSPTEQPPSGNVAAPINVSATAQSKSGPLSIGTTAQTQTLTVAGTIGATGDICTAAGGGKCLGTVSAALPSGTAGQTLRHNGTNWITNSAIFNNGTYVGIGNTNPGALLTVGNGTNTYPTTPAGRSLDLNGGSLARLAMNDGTGNFTQYLNSYYDSASASHKYQQNAPANRFLTSAGTYAFYVAPSGTAGNPITWTTALGIDNAGDVGIGTTAPGAKLEVAGQVKITGGTPGLNKVLTSDAAGLATWQTPASGVGGSGTANYLSKWATGTTLGNSNVFDNGTNVGVGTATPSAQLEVFGVPQLTATLTDAGSTNGMLALNGNSTSAGSGGAITFGNSQSRAAGSLGFAAIKGLLTNGGTNTIGDLAFSTRNAVADTALTERMRILSSGNVGIGTIAPGAKLEVAGQVKITGGTPGLNKVLTSDATGLATWQTPASGFDATNIATGVGIGQSNTTAGSLMVGSNTVTQVALGNGDLVGGSTTGGFQFDGSGGNLYMQKATANAAGNWILGRKSRGTMSAAAAVISGDDTLLLRGYGHDGTGFIENARITFDTEGTIGTGVVPGVMRFATASPTGVVTDRMTIDSDGNVGVGTTAPTVKLDVNGTIRAGASALLSTGGSAGYYQDATNGAYRAIVGSGTTNGYYFQTNGGAATTMYVGLGGTYNGNVGIGTIAPGAKLAVSSGDSSLALFGPNASWGGKLYVGASPNQGVAATAQVISTDGNLHLDPAPSKNMYLGYYQPRDIYIAPTGGNVGIGTTAPTKKLDVVGGDALINGMTVGKGGGGVSLNTSIGVSALAANTSGSWNTATGYLALTANTSGGDNTANGMYALRNNTTGSGNTAFGSGALYSNTTGSSNTAIGDYAMGGATTSTGNHNTVVGQLSLINNTTGGYNVVVGNQSMNSNTTGSNNTAIGYGAGVTAAGLTNATAIGFVAGVGASNMVRIGNASVTLIQGQVGWSAASDARLKKDVVDYVHGLDFITKLRPVEFKFKSDETNKPHDGFIAQEVEAIGIPFAGINKPQNDKDYYSLDYAQFVVPLVNSVKELKAENDKLNAKVDKLELENKNLLSRIEAIEARLK